MNDKTITIRAFRFPGDFDSVYKLWLDASPGIQLGLSDEIEEIKKKVDRDPDLFLVAVQDKIIIGSVLGGYDGRRGIVYHLVVAEEHREGTVGSLLMATLEERLREKGCLRCYLLVTPENTDAQHFYEKRGWERMNLRAYAKNLD